VADASRLFLAEPGAEQAWGDYVLQQLGIALNQQALYGSSHAAALHAADAAAEALSLLLEEEAECRLAVPCGSIAANGQAASSTTLLTASLAEACARHDIGQLVVHRGVTAAEVAELIRLLGKSQEELSHQGGLSTALAREGVGHIACAGPGPVHQVSGRPPPSAPRTRLAAGAPAAVDGSLVRTYTNALDVIQESAQQARLGGMLNASASRVLASQLADSAIEDRAKLLGLLSIRRHDEYTFQHSLNICVLALALGMAMGLSRTRLQELGLAALLHDVGKAWVPLEVLRKPGPLDEQEVELIRRHPVEGAAYLVQQLEIPPAAAVVAFQHHLRYDQRGYPRLRWPQTLNVYSLIVGLADSYEALTSERPYRRTLGPEEALRVMLATPPGQFEPRLLALLAEMLGRSDLVGAPRATDV
jgi:hypothetical protein